ncbi:MAG: hypothetical protein GDA41_05600 [Rhodospirillales bacterium]|nr:hypothetical protein [Rhodospirillales bacterium]
MSIVEEVATALSRGDRKKKEMFEEQLRAYEEFRKKMEAAGISPKKRNFSIPLIERIGTPRFLD